MFKKCIVLGLIIIFLSTSIINAEEIVKQKKDYGAVWRSAILPGWGQIYLGQKKKGIIIMASEIMLIGLTYAYWEWQEYEYDKYIKCSDPEEMQEYYNRATEYHNLSNYCLLSAVVLWGYNILDSYNNENKIKRKKNIANIFINFTNIFITWNF